MRFRIAELAMFAWLAPVAFGHQQPTTLMALDAGSDYVKMTLHVPLSELELAFGHRVTERPEETVAVWGPALRTYLTGHIHPVTAGGEPFSVRVNRMSVGSAEQTQSGLFQEVILEMALIPPPGANLRHFRLHYDAILHQVVSHKVIVSLRSDWASGRLGPTRLGVIAVDTGSGRVEPLMVDLGPGSWTTGFTAMVRLGAEHIRDGTDHLLFLLVLLLPAAVGTRILRIVTAYTLGHSVTLLAGAAQWLRLPQQGVEVLIAVSILLTAIHAIRPLFPGREEYVAGGFGLVHGLAFATVLTDLQLDAGAMALSILGFNLGIELMQLLVIACTAPWLILLSRTPAHRCVRVVGGVLAGTAALGWIGNRLSGVSNPIERGMTAVTAYSPLGIFLLAFIAMTAYVYMIFARPAAGVAIGRNPQ